MTEIELQEIERRLENTEFGSRGPGMTVTEQTVRDLIDEVRRLQRYSDQLSAAREVIQHPPVP